MELDTIPAYDFGDGNHLAAPEIEINDFAEVFLFLLEPARFKVAYGGRGSGKTWHFAKALILLAVTTRKRILCCREYQSSIAESVHYTLVDQIHKMGLAPWFEITDRSIYCPATGSEFIFKGLKMHINEIKSTEGIDIVWIEEGQATSRKSLVTLLPTIRAPNSEIWISYNPLNEDDPVHQDFVLNPVYPEFDADGKCFSIVRQVNFSDNPWFGGELEKLRQIHLNDPASHDLYMHIWEGHTLQISDAMIFKGKWEVRDFDSPPPGTRLHFGLDFGFANDPSCAVRCWVQDQDLMVDYAIYGEHVEIDDLPAMMAGDDPMGKWTNPHGHQGIPGADKWPIRADQSQPATISYLARQGLNVDAAEKWPGSVEDGIAHLRAFRKIVIHPRCKGLIREAFLYRFKVDQKTNEVLPIIVDKHNHGWDAIRYALDGYIQRRGEMGLWLRLGRDD